MAKRTKKYLKNKKEYSREEMPLKNAIAKVKKLSYSKFKGSVDLHISLRVPKNMDVKSLKGSVTLPHSSGNKDVKVAVFCKPEKDSVAKDAGADLFNIAELVKDVKAGKIEFDVAIATPDVMAEIALLGKQLGPRGLMPNPKTGTVTDDIANAVAEYKKGKLNFKCDDSGNMHFSVGNISMEEDQLTENIMAAISAASETIGKRPAQVITKGYLAPTMGPSVKIKFDFEE